MPDEGYLARCAEICKKHNVLLICDEIQTGLCRTGKMCVIHQASETCPNSIRLCYEWDGIKPDMVILGKALSGGSETLHIQKAEGTILMTSVPRFVRHGQQGDHALYQTWRARVNIRRVGHISLYLNLLFIHRY